MPNIDPNLPNKKGKTLMDYVPAAMQALGLGKQDRPDEGDVQEHQEDAVPFNAGQPAIGRKEIEKAIQTLKEYKDGKSSLEERIKEEEEWFKLRHWDVIRNKKNAEDGQDRPEPTSAWLFNSLANKHADIMDNYPEPNVLPRERQDEQDAQILGSVLPVVYERNDYEKTYSRAAWYKLKHGVAAKGVFWNQELEDGLGDVDNRFLDIMNLFWEPGITELQSSRNFFIVSLKDNDLLEQEYPDLKGKLTGQIIDVKQYAHDDQVDISKKSLLVDWYYKKRTPEGKTILHLCKFCGSEILFASENEPDKYPNGFYEHGRYPVEFDVLFPEEGTPIGFGYIAIMKSPQIYIDKLSQVILENSIMYAKPRYFAKKNVGINHKQFLDLNQPIVDVEGDINEERFRPIEVNAVPGNVLNVLQMKIDELKETSSNRDFSQGGTGSGVTAAAAIAALQEAGNKTSRDMISESYRSYTQECYLAIELIRQFYDEVRTFRITGETGKNEYIQFSNASIKGQPIPPAYPGQELEPGYVPSARKPVFDIVVKAQKRSPYSKMAQNELAKELYQMGFFNPQLAEQSLSALELMDFDGDEKVRDRVEKGQTLMNQMAAMQQTMNKMGAVIFQLTGQDVLGLAQGGPPAPSGGGITPQVDSMGKAAKDAQTETMTAYGQRLAARAKPDMSQS